MADVEPTPEEITSELRSALHNERVQFDEWCEGRRTHFESLEHTYEINKAQTSATLQALSLNEQNIERRREEADQVRKDHRALLDQENVRKDQIVEQYAEHPPKVRFAFRQ